MTEATTIDRPTFTVEEATQASLDYFEQDKLAADVFISKYALRDTNGNLYEKTPSDMHKRLAKEFARIEARYPNAMSESYILDRFSKWLIVPQGSPMAAIGNPFQTMSSGNCYVVESPHDSYAGLLHTDQEQVQIMKRRGGVGFDLSTVRPRNCTVENAARTTDGVKLFMERFSDTCREVAQSGRRGALMLSLSVHHPDICDFITAKIDRTKVTGANISVRLSDEFMRAVEADTVYVQRFPLDPNKPALIEREVRAREVWDLLVQTARDTSEPGVLFWDTLTRESPADCYADEGFTTVSTNPCGELPLCPDDSCRLMAITLNHFVRNPFTTSATYDFDALTQTAYEAQKLMDDLIDLEEEAMLKILSKIDADPEPDHIKFVEQQLWTRILDKMRKGRRTGLGITALGDAIAYMGYKYGSPESVSLTGQIYRALALGSYRASVDMARDRGAFPIWNIETERANPFIRRVLDEDAQLAADYALYGRRNIANLTTAPTGSLSIETQTTSGCEPVLFVEAERKRKVKPDDAHARVDYVDASGDCWQKYQVAHHGVDFWREVTGQTDATLSPYHGSTVEDIDWLRKIDIQAAAQRWVDHSISNTTNLPNEVTTETVEALYKHAWKTGCKGATVYRIGSRDAVIEKVAAKPEKSVRDSSSNGDIGNDDDDNDAENGTNNGTNVVDFHSESERPRTWVTGTHAPERPDVLACDVHFASVGGTRYAFLVGLLDGRPYEIFAGRAEKLGFSKSPELAMLVKRRLGNRKQAAYDLRATVGGVEAEIKDVIKLFDEPLYGAFSRTISLALRHGAPVQYVAEQLMKDQHSAITSFEKAASRVLGKNYIEDGSRPASQKSCDDCGSTSIAYQEGCLICLDCGSSKCG